MRVSKSKGGERLLQRPSESDHGAILLHRAQDIVASLNADEAFLAGLLHGVGRLYILRRVQDYPELLGHEPALRAVIDAWHHSVGFALLTHWGLALDLARAVNDYGCYDPSSEGAPNLTAVLYLADLLAQSIERSNDALSVAFPRCRSLDLPDETWRSVVTVAQDELKHFRHVLSL